MQESLSSSRPTTPAEQPLVVRVANERDRSELGALLRAAKSEVLDKRGNELRLTSLPSDPSELLDYLLSDSNVSALVAEDSAELSGFGLISNDPPRLLAIYVAATQRRKGVARALVGEAAALCERRGSGALTAVVAAGDRAEKSLYEALGYRAELLVMAPRVRPVVVDQQHE